MDTTIIALAIVCPTLVALVAIGAQTDNGSRTASKAMDTLKSILRK